MRVETKNISNDDCELPPVRAALKPDETLETIKTNSQRIASSDYNRWEKYDAGMTWVYFSILFLYFRNV